MTRCIYTFALCVCLEVLARSHKRHIPSPDSSCPSSNPFIPLFLNPLHKPEAEIHNFVVKGQHGRSTVVSALLRMSGTILLVSYEIAHASFFICDYSSALLPSTETYSALMILTFSLSMRAVQHVLFRTSHAQRFYSLVFSGSVSDSVSLHPNTPKP